MIGAGHAGCEAALASARMGCRTLMLTMNLDAIGQMSCNPAVGGTAKGHLVREIDALGGEMGRATDLATIQFKMLNASRGPAVRSSRAQCDRARYRAAMKHAVEAQPGLDVRQGQVDAPPRRGRRGSRASRTRRRPLRRPRAVVVTAGTFLRGLIHVGLRRALSAGGRGSSPPSISPTSLRELGLALGRLKTGTSPRLRRSTIDFTRARGAVGRSRAVAVSLGAPDAVRCRRCLPRHVHDARPRTTSSARISTARRSTPA